MILQPKLLKWASPLLSQWCGHQRLLPCGQLEGAEVQRKDPFADEEDKEENYDEEYRATAVPIKKTVVATRQRNGFWKLTSSKKGIVNNPVGTETCMHIWWQILHHIINS